MTETKTEENSSQLKPAKATVRLSGMLPDLKAHLIFWSLALGGLLLDLWSKKAVFGWLNQEQSHNIPIIDGFMQFITALNDGAAFSIFAGKAYILTAISIVALLVVFGVFLFSGTKYRLIHVALGFFAGGICGNLHDRIFNDGLVRDFVDVYIGNRHWPTFNVADSLLCVGVGLLIISTLLTEQSSQKHAQQQK
ncbi:MAG: signal peptidase II [Sedimentisphaerales bacterium]|nr:signal peptidase II [Sedimentisphaerales bacterium]